MMEAVDYFKIAEVIDGNPVYIENREEIEAKLRGSVQDKINLDCLEKFSLSERLILLYIELDCPRSSSILNNLKYYHSNNKLDEFIIKGIKNRLTGEAFGRTVKAMITRKSILKQLYRKEPVDYIISWHTIEDDSTIYEFYLKDNGRTVFRVNRAGIKKPKLEISTNKLMDILNLGCEHSGVIRANVFAAIVTILVHLGKRNIIDSLVVAAKGAGSYIDLMYDPNEK